MQVIDVEAMRSPRRETPQITFRRTDADRRPARVVLRPQDGPGDWQTRQKIAEERMAQAKRGSTPFVERPATPAEIAQKQRLRRLGFILTQLAAAPVGLSVRDLAVALGASHDAVNRLIFDLHNDGLVSRSFKGVRGGGRISVVKVTDAGRSSLAGGDQ